ncbi:MAG: hypothetical protein SWH61_05035 [Thermodesulfobacteriota bacterium]|nr:hypothetical protein [Thermodesulfobacteriota bacterium]
MQKKHFFLSVLLLLPILLFSGCIYKWAKIETPELSPASGEFKIQAPVGWVNYEGHKEQVLLTKDGTSLQYISIMRLDYNQAFPAMEVMITKDTLVTELAEYFFTDFKKRYNDVQVEKIDTRPATIAGFKGFRSHLEFANAKGLLIETVAYGFVNENGYYEFEYQAPKLHYFKRDIKTFEKIVGSFKFLDEDAQKAAKKHRSSEWDDISGGGLD